MSRQPYFCSFQNHSHFGSNKINFAGIELPHVFVATHIRTFKTADLRNCHHRSFSWTQICYRIYGYNNQRQFCCCNVYFVLSSTVPLLLLQKSSCRQRVVICGSKRSRCGYKRLYTRFVATAASDTAPYRQSFCPTSPVILPHITSDTAP